jgi:hypothetical protein
MILALDFSGAGYAENLQGKVFEGNEADTTKPLQNVTVKLYGSNNSGSLGVEVASTVTNASGVYILSTESGFEHFNIVETDPSGYYSVAASTVSGIKINNNQIQYSMPLRGKTLTGNRFWDKPNVPANRKPVADAGGPYSGTAGQSVTVDGSASSDPDAGDSIAEYEWDLDGDGQYDDAYIAKPQWTWNSAGTKTAALRVTDTHGATDIDQATVTVARPAVKTGEVRGVKFNDENGDGICNGSEPGLAGWTIFADASPYNSALDASEHSGMTGPDGSYSITGLPPGTYNILEAAQSDWQATCPAAGFYNVIIEGDDLFENRDFGNHRTGADTIGVCMRFDMDIAGLGLSHCLLSGSAVQSVSFGSGTAGLANDKNGNGRDEVDVAWTALELSGMDPLAGHVRLSLDPLHPATGELEEAANYTPGILDVPPYTASGSVDAFILAYFKIDLPDLGISFRTDLSKGLAAKFDHLPPSGNAEFNEAPPVTVNLLRTPGDLQAGTMGPVTSCGQQPGGGGSPKWGLPPAFNPDSPHPECYWGWDQVSVYSAQIAADDWMSVDERPVTDLHWWGSYLGWDADAPPESGPASFHIAVWTDVPAGVDETFGHPGTLIWECTAGRNELKERKAGCDFHPRKMESPESCFQYDIFLPQAQWFYAESQKTYWLSIAAMYASPPTQNQWGWKTREPYFGSAAVEISDPAMPVVGETYRSGSPLDPAADLAFILTTNEQEGDVDYGDAPMPYPEASHELGGPYLGPFGDAPDAETLMQRDAQAAGDDNAGSDDENGLLSINLVKTPGLWSSFKVKAWFASSSDLKIAAWLDLNGDGDWDDAEDSNYSFGFCGLGSGPSDWASFMAAFPMPAPAKAGHALIRLRVYDDCNDPVAPSGSGGKGEVEDHWVEIKADGDGLPPGGIVHGSKWNDLSGDGKWDPGEPPLAGWTIWLDSNGNGIQDSGDATALTDAAGNFQFSGLAKADFLVGEAPQAGWVQTWPGGTGTHLVSVDPSRPSPGVLFGNRQEESSGSDWGDAPDPAYHTLAANNGASHALVPGFYLGAGVDGEPDGAPHPDALGDDQDASDDEDGIAFTSPVLPGQTASLNVTASAAGILNAWVDFNRNGDWADAGEHVFSDLPLNAGINALTFAVPAAASQGKALARFRFSTAFGLAFDGPASDGEVEDMNIPVGEVSDGTGARKWRQAPLYHSPDDTAWHWGWRESSTIPEHAAADDWFCLDPRPVTSVRWWGAYAVWDSAVPPPNAPVAFHIGVWTDMPRNDEQPWSRPGEMIHDWIIERAALNETLVDSVFFEGRTDKPLACFRYDFRIPQSRWFHQAGDSTIYWLSISAIYQRMPLDTTWGWVTREHYFSNDAVRLIHPLNPQPGEPLPQAEPMAEGWDLAFELGTDVSNFNLDFGDAPETGYATAAAWNGACHLVNPAVYLGYRVDAEADGRPQSGALGDDNSGVDDEDGINFDGGLVLGQDAWYTVRLPASGFLGAWIDFDRDGTWRGDGEHVLSGGEYAPGIFHFKVRVPDDAVPGPTFARFRFGTRPDAHWNGLAVNGEVEDFALFIQDHASTAPGERGILPDRFALLPNFPNPFNPSTEIRFELPELVRVRLTVFDLTGRLVAVLVDAPLEAGLCSVRWDGRNLHGMPVSSGVYLVRMEAGKFRATRKILFLR